MYTNSNEIQNNAENYEKPQTEITLEAPFKKPTLLIGKRGKLPRKLQSFPSSKISENLTEKATVEENHLECTVEKATAPSPEATLKDENSPGQQQSENLIPIPYKEPSWSGLPETSRKPYVLEVLKNGSIIETIDLMKKAFWVFGRLGNCDICMQHPTISRYHLVLQFRDIPSETDPPGFYVYDLGSTHGTFLNGKTNKLKPRVYAPMRVGHMLRLGCSLRSYILTGPEDDQEEESEFTVTELKQIRAQKIKDHEARMRQAELEREEKKKKEEERGVDWGLGDDADETEDLPENPYASTNNEDLYLDDPKKALRGFFEREGLELEYDCSEQGKFTFFQCALVEIKNLPRLGLGQFLCKVELPLDDELGRPIVSEVLHRGKKKEAVIQCALEACRILDRFGVLRQATHESRKRKAKNWEENDYYDSDDDTFLDRTGTIEKKREKRMKAKEPEKAETYESLLEKEKQISWSISQIEERIPIAEAKFAEGNGNASADEDSLDSYMKGLQEHKPDRQTVSKLKFELVKLKKDHANVVRLVNIAKPTDLPSLVPETVVANLRPSTSTGKTIKQIGPGLLVGKRKGKSVQYPLKLTNNDATLVYLKSNEECEEESDEEMGGKRDNEEISEDNVDTVNQNVDIKKIEEYSEELPHICGNEKTSEENDRTKDVKNRSDRIKEIEVLDNMQMSGGSKESSSYMEHQDADQALLSSSKSQENEVQSGSENGKRREKLLKILNQLKRLASNEDRMHVDWLTLSAKKRKVVKLIADLRFSENDEKLEYKVSSELNRISDEISAMTEEKFKAIGKVKRMGSELQNISVEIDRDIQALKQDINTFETKVNEDNSNINPEPGPSNENAETKDDGVSDDKKKKKNQKRIEQRQQKAEIERQRGYEEDAARENYSMWVPPNDQSGDGKTKLNEKYGY